jgi:O-antigen/teichoic acid export membrane protein
MISELKVLGRIKWPEVKAVGLKYNKYPKHLLPGNLVNRYTSDLPIYLLTAYFSPAMTGAFVLANSVMNIPLNVLGNSIASVFLQRANELYIDDKEKLKSFAITTNKKLVLAGVVTFGVLFGFGDVIFEIVFGDEWFLAGQMAMILSVYFIFKLAAGPMAKVFRVVGKEEYSLYASVVLGVCRSLGVVLGVLTDNPLNTIIYFSAGSILGYLFTYMLVFRSCGIGMFHSLIHMIKYVILGLSISWAFRLMLDF